MTALRTCRIVSLFLKSDRLVAVTNDKGGGQVAGGPDLELSPAMIRPGIERRQKIDEVSEDVRGRLADSRRREMSYMQLKLGQ